MRKLIPIGRALRFEVAAIGVALTLIIVGLDVLGQLAPLEHYLGDLRTRYFQRGYPDPRQRLVHLDLDDASLIAVGRWPWPRTKQAEILTELARAKPKVVALDVIETQVENPDPRYEKAPDGSFHLIQGDQALADSLARLGNVTLAASVRNQQQEALSPGDRALLAVLRDRPALEPAEAEAALESAGLPPATAKGEVDKSYLALRRLAVDARVEGAVAAEPPGAPLSTRALYTALGADPTVRGPLQRLIDDALAQAQSVRELRRFCAPLPPGLRFVYSRPVDLVPLPEFLHAAAGAGAVTYLQDASPDGRIRSVPLMVEVDGKLLPELGLALACGQLGVDVHQIRVTPNAVVLPAPGGDISIPVSTRDLGKIGDVALMFDLPWFGGSDWETMYDPQRKAPACRMPVTLLNDVITTQEHITQNLALADDAITYLIDSTSPDKQRLQKFRAAASAAPADWSVRDNAIAGLITDLTPSLGEPDPRAAATEKDPHVARLLQYWADVHRLGKEVPALQNQLVALRQQIAGKIAGKSVLIGWTANAVAADFVATPLHSKCPGVNVHGVVFNAIMTRAFVRPAPAWAALAATLFAGLVTTVAVCWPSIVRGLLGAAVVAIAYTLFDADFLYKSHGIAMDLAGPTTAGAAVWSVCTLVRFLMERAERERLKRRFQSYVDPKIVQYVLERGGEEQLAGELREMTVVFTDLAGFTTISETLGERTVQLLNEYFGAMVPIIRANHGVLNKFLGDGMMFFFGAPQDNPRHARDAVSAVLQMQQALAAFNRRLSERGLPPVKMRAGITTGPMVAGDAGCTNPTASDYTVLGDNVNLAARLESANKASGTLILCSERTIQLIGDGFLVRPVGRLQVVGKTEWVMTYEIMCLDSEATPEQRQIAEITTRLVDAYIAGDFATCEAACDQLEQLTGPDKLLDLYRKMCDRCRETATDRDTFRGEIVLAEK